MSIKILGISGSPIKNSNTNRLVKAMLEATGLESQVSHPKIKTSSVWQHASKITPIYWS